jgi:hypothetical protein
LTSARETGIITQVRPGCALRPAPRGGGDEMENRSFGLAVVVAALVLGTLCWLLWSRQHLVVPPPDTRLINMTLPPRPTISPPSMVRRKIPPSAPSLLWGVGTGEKAPRVSPAPVVPTAAARPSGAAAPLAGDAETLRTEIAEVLPLGEGGALIRLAPEAPEPTATGTPRPAALPTRKVLQMQIGMAEAFAIQMEREGITPPRPLTHDLLATMIRELGATVERITVTELRDGVFYGLIRLRLADGTCREIDARPSDSMALALRFKAPIYVNLKVLEEAGQEPEEGVVPRPATAAPSPPVYF